MTDPATYCYLGIDYGAKRIGLAISNATTQTAMPLATVAGRGNVAADASSVWSTARAYTIHAIVIGLPLNMDDSEGPQAKVVRAFGTALAALTDLPVHYQDERLSSVAADELMMPAELTRKKKKARKDQVAATVILQEFLEGGQVS